MGSGLQTDLALSAGSSSLDALCDRLYTDLRGSPVPYDRIGVALLEPSGRLIARWARAEYPALDLYRGWSAPLSPSLRGLLETGEPRIINDLNAYLREHPGSLSTQRILYEGIRANLTCPLVAAGEPVGFSFFSSRRAGCYREEHIPLLRAVAERISIAIERSQRS